MVIARLGGELLAANPTIKVKNFIAHGWMSSFTYFCGMGLIDFTYVAESYSSGDNWGSFADWVSAFSTFLAVIVALIALVLSERASRNTYRPFISVYYLNMDNHIEIGLKNVGNGPGVVFNYYAWIAGEPIPNPHVTIQNLDGIPEPPDGYWSDYLIRRNGVAIAPGGSEPLIKIKQEEVLPAQYLADLRAFLSTVRFHYTYQNFLGQTITHKVTFQNPDEVFLA